MESINEQQRRELIGEFYSKFHSSGKAFTVKHFMDMGFKRTAIYETIKRIDDNKPLIRKERNRKFDQKTVKSVLRQMNGKLGSSCRKVGQRHGISKSFVNVIIKQSDLRCYKRQKVPKVSDTQKQVIKTRLRYLREGMLKPSLNLIPILDDESYFSIDGHINEVYYTDNKENVPISTKYIEKSKFSKKLLVWIAISEKGLSQSYIAPSGIAINSEVYINECIQSKLVAYINKYFKNDEYVFWPDLASSHYSKKALEAYKELNIKFVPKEQNPPNCPQLRPIEDFWAILKRKVYEKGWKAKSIDDLKRRIKLKIKTFDQTVCQRLMSGLHTKVRLAADLGYESAFH